MRCGQMAMYIKRFEAADELDNRFERIKELEKLQRDFEYDAKIPLFNPTILEQFKEEQSEVYTFWENVGIARKEELTT